jgi:hypothetical protein
MKSKNHYKILSIARWTLLTNLMHKRDLGVGGTSSRRRMHTWGGAGPTAVREGNEREERGSHVGPR